ncbi:MAG: hypothetical protein JSW52_12145 [Candidatus Coatesbacteria bacterium]|nr:MAG: hypothetical protein JSW52_12145 [Candidatus Coatesbacteria bacterium]
MPTRQLPFFNVGGGIGIIGAFGGNMAGKFRSEQTENAFKDRIRSFYGGVVIPAYLKIWDFRLESEYDIVYFNDDFTGFAARGERVMISECGLRSESLRLYWAYRRPTLAKMAVWPCFSARYLDYKAALGAEKTDTGLPVPYFYVDEQYWAFGGGADWAYVFSTDDWNPQLDYMYLGADVVTASDHGLITTYHAGIAAFPRKYIGGQLFCRATRSSAVSYYIFGFLIHASLLPY